MLTETQSDADFLAWGWRVPFLASAVLVFVGPWVRLTLTETPAFQRAVERAERVRVPILVVCREHARTLVLATLAAITTFVVFYLMTVFTLAWGTAELGYTRQEFLRLQIIGVLFLALTAQGQVRYGLKTPYRDGTTHIVLEPLDFIARLAALVPQPRMHLTRFHAVFAPHAGLRAAITPAGRGPGAHPRPPSGRRRNTWP